MAGANVVEVSSEHFEQEVLARSADVPVLVDFWAPWCGPCRMLGPVLEKLAEEMNGAFVLAKINSDENPEIASTFGVRGIPDVKLFRDGKVVDGFVGAQPERQVREFLAKHCPSEADELVATGLTKADEGNIAAARTAFEGALELDPKAAAAHLGLARLAMAARDFDSVETHTSAVHMGSDEYDAAEKLRQAVGLAREAASVCAESECSARIDADPSDLDALFARAGHRVAAGNYEGALADYLAVAEQDRKWHDEAARKAMLVVFGIIGARHALSNAYREKLMFIY